jgi:threonyl-tRNA synthetase
MEKDHNNDPLYKIRHSLAHVLAQAVLEIRPTAKLAFGPPIDIGCYYDFDFDTPLTPEDFPDIEKRMERIIKEKQPFTSELLPAAAAIARLREQDQNYKVEYCEELASGGEQEIGFFTNGPFTDMCAGPHLEHTGQIPHKCFKIDSLAGAYWRGSEKNPQLTRIYCLAFEDKAQLKDYLERRRLAEERDHRKLGKELELFMISEEVGPGLPLWMPNGTVLREELEALAKEQEARYGYQRVSTPHIAKEGLYHTSGHLPYYADTMFPPMQLDGEDAYYLKAMNCPHHHLIFGNRPRSYRELPLRLAEYGTCYRYEASGKLSGLLRVRCMGMNDAHIYCTLEQNKEELKKTFQLTLDYYKMFRLDGVQVRLSFHDPANKEKYIENPEAWAFTEQVLREVVEDMGVEHFIAEDEAAFYGPKIDFQAKNILGKEESISTTQLDFAGGKNFSLTYIAEDGKEHMPYIIHRAPLGTHERFLSFLIEHFGGAFPTWMAPEQVRIIPVREEVLSYARELEDLLRSKLFRVNVDHSNNSFNKKIREAVIKKIPNMIIIGENEMGSGSVTLRRYCVKEQISLSKENFIERMVKLRSERVMDNFADVVVD